jgi:hypothetical protein
MDKDIYLRGLLVQTGGMEATVHPAMQSRAPASEGGALIGRVLLCELALTATFFATPAHGQSYARVDLVGYVEARCSAVTPAGVADMEAGEVLSRALTVRCSGPTPALSVRTHASDDPEVTLTVASAARSASGGRLSTQEGNVVLGLADMRPTGTRVQRSRGPVEIIVAPAW